MTRKDHDVCVSRLGVGHPASIDDRCGIDEGLCVSLTQTEFLRLDHSLVCAVPHGIYIHRFRPALCASAYIVARRAGRAPRLATMSDAPSRGLRRTTGGMCRTQSVLDCVDDEAHHKDGFDDDSDEADEADDAAPTQSATPPSTCT